MRYYNWHRGKIFETPKSKALRALQLLRSEIRLGPDEQVEYIEMSLETFKEIRTQTLSSAFDFGDTDGDLSCLAILMGKKVLENNALKFGKAKVYFFNRSQ